MSVPVESSPPFRFLCPANILCLGASQSGKSTFILELLRHPDLFDKPTSQIYWHYGVETNHMPSQPLIQTVQGLPDSAALKHISGDAKDHKIVVIDDLLTESIANKELLTQLWTRGSHHYNMTFILLGQSLFEISRIVRNNSHYVILFKALSDQLNIANYGRQIFPGKMKYFLDSFEDATRRRYGYLIVCGHPKEDQAHFRLRRFIYRQENREKAVRSNTREDIITVLFSMEGW